MVLKKRRKKKNAHTQTKPTTETNNYFQSSTEYLATSIGDIGNCKYKQNPITFLNRIPTF